MSISPQCSTSLPPAIRMISMPVNLAYVITDSKGHAVVSQIGEGRLPLKTSGGPSPLTFNVTASIPPGDYMLKIAVLEGDRLGSVEHPIHARTIPPASR